MLFQVISHLHLSFLTVRETSIAAALVSSVPQFQFTGLTTIQYRWNPLITRYTLHLLPSSSFSSGILLPALSLHQLPLSTVKHMYLTFWPSWSLLGPFLDPNVLLHLLYSTCTQSCFQQYFSTFSYSSLASTHNKTISKGLPISSLLLSIIALVD